MKPIARRLFVPSALLALAACDQGTLSVDLTDAPVDDASVIQVQFDGIEILRGDGTTHNFDFPAAKQIDLLDLQNGDVTALLGDVDLNEGEYTGVRLKVSAPAVGDMPSFVTIVEGAHVGTHRLVLPEANVSKLTVAGAFSVTAREKTSLTIDFDMRRSVLRLTDTAADYTLVPVLRLINNADSGEIAGTVAAARIAEGCVPAVYVYAGSGVTPDDVGSGVAPITSAKVASGAYRVAFLPVGSYTVAFTCDARQDNPSVDQAAAEVTLETPQDAAVTAGATRTINF